MAIGLGKLFQDMLKIGVADAAKKNIPDMVGRMFAKKEPTTDEVLQILEDERKQRAAEFVGGERLSYQSEIDDAPNITIPEPLVQSTSGSIIPQRTIVPQIVDAPRGTVVRNLGSLFLEVERINANIAAMSRAMRDSAILEKKYRDELIKSKEQDLSQRDKLQSRSRAQRGQSQTRSFFNKQLRRGQRKVRGMTEGFLEATLFSFALEVGAMVVNSIKGAFDPPPDPAPSSGKLADLISGGEGDYESVNFGKPDDAKGKKFKDFFGKTLAESTVSDVDKLQKQGKVSAVGRYQITPIAMPGFIEYLEKSGVDPNTAKLGKETQDMYFDYFLTSKKEKVGQYLKGQNVSLDEAVLEVAAEFASVGVPYDMKKGSYKNSGFPIQDIKKGQSLYHGYQNNESQPGLMEKVRESLQKEREANQARGRGRSRQGQGGPDTAMPDASRPGASGIPGDPNSPRIGDYVGGSRSSSLVRPMSLEIASIGQNQVSIIEQYYDMKIPTGGATALGSPTEIPDREPKRPGGVYEEYMGVA